MAGDCVWRARDKELTALWMGGNSAGQIAAHFGDVSRNAVIGRVFRLGLRRMAATKPTKISYPAVRAAPRSLTIPRGTPDDNRLKVAIDNAQARAVPIITKPEIVPAEAKHWSERKSGECAFPLGTGEDLLSCCMPVVRGPYCGVHSKIAYQPNKPRALRAPPEFNVSSTARRRT